MLYLQTMQKGQKTTEETPSHHWADHAAEELLQLHPGKDTFVCASGISPSGVVHIGNFREVITVEFVVRALRERGKKVRFIYSWDDYDAFRKVPANLPNREMLEQHLRKPISAIPDPFGEHPSYAGHFEKRFEKEISPLGIKPEYLYQNEAYRSCRYAEGIRHALENQRTIAQLLNTARTEPLPEDWTCVSIFCKKCNRDTTLLTSYEAPWILKYRCKACKEDFTMDFSKEGGAKLLWRVDWPRRGARDGVDFEPGGQDHSSQGGSFETGADIIRTVWKKEPPHYVQYDFVLAKGAGSKLSSSSGNLITVGEALEIYEPDIIRWIFASRKPNIDFSIAFDLDVIKAYDDFDRTERFAYGNEEGDEKKVTYERRIYQLSCVETPKLEGDSPPAQFPFRHLCNILQINLGDFEKTATHFKHLCKTEKARARFDSRVGRAWKWITTFAPDDFKFAPRELDSTPPAAKYPEAVKELIAMLGEPGFADQAEEVIANRIYQAMKTRGIEAKLFFKDVYEILIGKPSGPKLASFFLALGPERAARLLQNSLHQ